MKYTIQINQRAAVEAGMNLDLIDLAVFDTLKDYANSPNCRRMQEGRAQYFTMPYKMIIEDLPLAGLTKPDSVYRRIKKLEIAGILELHPENKLLKQVWLCWGRNYDKMVTGRKTGYKSVRPDENPELTGYKSGLRPDGNPSSNNTNPYTDTKEASKLAAAPEPQKPASLVHQMRDVFEANHRLHFSPDGQWVGFKWSDKEFGQLKNLSSTLSKRLEDKTQRTPTDAEILAAFDAFLKSAAKDAWHLQNSYMPSKLNSAFQEIVQRAAAPKTDRTPANTSTTAAPDPWAQYRRKTA
jgi:hypothetical protein